MALYKKLIDRRAKPVARFLGSVPEREEASNTNVEFQAQEQR